jgi:hypothetical protein
VTSRKTSVVIRLTEESDAGGTACNWVEKRRGGYHLVSVECGDVGGPYATVVGALGCDGSQFGMAYMSIESSLPADEFKQALGSVALDEVWMLNVNGVQHQQPSADAVMAAYVSQL